MKQDLKDDRPPNKSSRWLALIALLALGFCAAAYSEVHRTATAGEQDQAMLIQLNEIAHLHIMLNQIGKGQLEAVRQQLKVKLAEDLADVRPLAAIDGTEPARYARTLLTSIDRYEKAHPDYYITVWPLPASGKSPADQSPSQVASRATTR